MSQTDPFVPDLVDMDLSPLYNKLFIIIVCRLNDGEANSSVDCFGPLPFEELICLVKDLDRDMVDWGSVSVANGSNRVSEKLDNNTLTYIGHKAEEILSEYMLIGHRDIDYDCKAEIIHNDISKLFKQ